MGERPTPPEVRRAAQKMEDEKTLKGNPFVCRERKQSPPERAEQVDSPPDEDISVDDYAREFPPEKFGKRDSGVSSEKDASTENAREFKYGFSEAGIVNALRDGNIEAAAKLIEAGMKTTEFADGKAVINELKKLRLVSEPAEFTLGGKIESLGEHTVPVELSVQGKTRRVELKFEVLDYGKSGVLICKDARVKLGKL